MRTQDCIIAFSEFIHNIGSHYSRNTRTVYTTILIQHKRPSTYVSLKILFLNVASFSIAIHELNVIDLKKPEVVTENEKAQQNDEVEVDVIQVSASV